MKLLDRLTFESRTPVWCWAIHYDGRMRFYHAGSSWSIAAVVDWPWFRNPSPPGRHWRMTWEGQMVERRVLGIWLRERWFEEHAAGKEA